MPMKSSYVEQTLKQWQYRFERYCENVYTHNTYLRYSRAIDNFLDWLPKYITYPWEVGAFHAKKYREYLIDTRGKSESAAYWTLTGLSTFWEYMLQNDYDVPINPWVHIAARASRSKPRQTGREQ